MEIPIRGTRKRQRDSPVDCEPSDADTTDHNKRWKRDSSIESHGDLTNCSSNVLSYHVRMRNFMETWIKKRYIYEKNISLGHSQGLASGNVPPTSESTNTESAYGQHEYHEGRGRDLSKVAQQGTPLCKNNPIVYTKFTDMGLYATELGFSESEEELRRRAFYIVSTVWRSGGACAGRAHPPTKIERKWLAEGSYSGNVSHRWQLRYEDLCRYGRLERLKKDVVIAQLQLELAQVHKDVDQTDHWAGEHAYLLKAYRRDYRHEYKEKFGWGEAQKEEVRRDYKEQHGCDMTEEEEEEEWKKWEREEVEEEISEQDEEEEAWEWAYQEWKVREAQLEEKRRQRQDIEPLEKVEQEIKANGERLQKAIAKDHLANDQLAAKRKDLNHDANDDHQQHPSSEHAPNNSDVDLLDAEDPDAAWEDTDCESQEDEEEQDEVEDGKGVQDEVEDDEEDVETSKDHDDKEEDEHDDEEMMDED